MTNEQAKAKAIQEAYGEHWEKVKDYINKNGWLNEGYYSAKDLGFLSNGTADVDFRGAAHTWRPRSLRGIEDNNGWNRIESEDDLPKEPGDYVFLTINGGRSTFPDFMGKGYNLNIYTHWKKADNPPIY